MIPLGLSRLGGDTMTFSTLDSRFAKDGLVFISHPSPRKRLILILYTTLNT